MMRFSLSKGNGKVIGFGLHYCHEYNVFVGCFRWSPLRPPPVSIAAYNIRIDPYHRGLLIVRLPWLGF